MHLELIQEIVELALLIADIFVLEAEPVEDISAGHPIFSIIDDERQAEFGLRLSLLVLNDQTFGGFLASALAVLQSLLRCQIKCRVRKGFLSN